MRVEGRIARFCSAWYRVARAMASTTHSADAGIDAWVRNAEGELQSINTAN